VPPARYPDRGAPEDNSDCIRFGPVAFARAHALERRPHQLAKIPNIRRDTLSPHLPDNDKNHAFAPFARFGTPHAMQSAWRIARQTDLRGNEMTAFSNYSQRFVAGFAALAISVLLFANTLATQAAEVHSVAGILA
jgi:hypothetical protein